MVTIWTLYAHIVTTPAGIFAIRAGLFFTVGRHDRRRSSDFGTIILLLKCVLHIFNSVSLDTKFC